MFWSFSPKDSMKFISGVVLILVWVSVIESATYLRQYK